MLELGLPEIKPEQGHNSAEHQRGWCSLLGDKLGGAEGFYGQPFIDSPRCVGYSSFRLSYKNMSNLSAYSCSVRLLNRLLVQWYKQEEGVGLGRRRLCNGGVRRA